MRDRKTVWRAWLAEKFETTTGGKERKISKLCFAIRGPTCSFLISSCVERKLMKTPLKIKRDNPGCQCTRYYLRRVEYLYLHSVVEYYIHLLLGVIP